jgi:hypothetical protein
MVQIPGLFQSAGWALPTLAFVLTGAWTCVCALLLARVMTRIAGNRAFEKRVEFANVLELLLPRWASLAALFALLATFVASNISNVVVSAQVADDILQGNARYMELQQKHDVLQGTAWVTQQLAAWEQRKAAALASKDMADEARASRRIVQLQRSMTEAQKAADAGNQPSHGSDAWHSQLSVVTQEQAKLQAEIERYKWLGDRLIEGR